MNPPGSHNPWDRGGALGPDTGNSWGQSGGRAPWDTGLGDDVVPHTDSLVPAGGLDSVKSWVAVYRSLPPSVQEILPPALFALYTFYPDTAGLLLSCLGGMRSDDARQFLDEVSKLEQGDVLVDLSDPCQIRRAAKVGSCFMRHGLGAGFVPDVQDFWLDGKAADPNNLRRETFQFPPDDRGTPVRVSYFPMDTAWFFGLHGTAAENWVVASQESSLRDGVLKRLRAPHDKVFPDDMGFSEEDVSPLRNQVPLGPGPSTLHISGIDWIYPKETVIHFDHPWQKLDQSGQVIADSQLFLLGGMTVTSEVEVLAEPGFLPGEDDVDGWTVTVLAWRVRISDRFDYHGEKTTRLPIPWPEKNEADRYERILEIPDQLFLLLQDEGCPGFPPPVDFDVISDTWHELPTGLLEWPSFFVTLEPREVADAAVYGGGTKSRDFFDPVTGAPIPVL